MRRFWLRRSLFARAQCRVEANERLPTCLAVAFLVLECATSSLSGQPTVYLYATNGISILDGTSNQIVTSIPLVVEFCSLAVAADGSRAFAVGYPNPVMYVFGQAGSVATITLPSAAGCALAVTPDGKYAYVGLSAGTIAVIDLTLSSVVRTIPVNGFPAWAAISLDGSRLYVNTTYNSVSVIDLGLDKVTATVAVGAHGLAVSPDGSRVYCALAGLSGAWLGVIDTKTNAFRMLNLSMLYGSAERVSASPDGKRLYVASNVSVLVMDMNSETLIRTIPITNSNTHSIAVSGDSSKLYVTNYESSSSSYLISILDTATFSVTDIATPTTGGYPVTFLVSTQPPPPKPLHGIDLSTNPSPTEWSNIIANLNPSFVIADAWGGRSECPGQSIFQCNTPTPAEQILSHTPSGLKKAAYALINYDTPTQSGATQIGFAIDSLGNQYQAGNTNGNISFMAVDVEPLPGESLPTDAVSLAARVQRIYDAVQAVERAGLKPVIYASQSNWTIIAGNTHPSFGCLPLWTPRYDGSDDLNSDLGNPWQPFGGWGQRVGKQYCENNTTCTTTLGAPDADLNVFTPTVFTTATWGMALDETNKVMISRSGFRLNHATNQYVQTVTVTNTSASAISGPITIALDGLSSNATLSNGNGYTSCTLPAFSSFIHVQQGILAPGQSVTANLQFSNPANLGISYTPRVLAGSATR